MQINWFPGHMHKASKEIKQILPKVDLIIEIVDARIPFSSANPMLAALRADKPCIKVLSKADLADAELTKQWQTSFEQQQGIKSLALQSNQPERYKLLPQLCHKMIPEKHHSVKALRTLIMGIPNVGKSTLINILAGRTIAKTGNEPAVTKTQQRINLPDNIVLFDTPGILWPKFETQHIGYRLASTGAIKDTAMDHADVAFYLADYLMQTYPDYLQSRYQLDTLPNSTLELMDAIAALRGCLRGGGIADLDKTGKLLIREFRASTLGNITLETPAMIEQEAAEQVLINQEKAAKKTARQLRRKNGRNT